MKLVFGPEIEQMSGSDGKIGGFVHMKLLGFPVARRHVLPAQPRTTAQVNVRAYLTAASQAFGSLTTPERAAWETLANLMTHSHLGFTYTPYAINAYISVNVWRQLDGQAIDDAAPSALAGFTGSSIGTVGYIAGTTVFSFILVHNGTAAVGFWAVSITPALASAQRAARPSDYRLGMATTADAIIAVSATPQTVELTGPIYTWTDGQYMAIKVVPLGAAYSYGTPYTHRGTITVT